MFGFGLCWYGPYQYYWYNLLDHLMPLKNTANFLTKVRVRAACLMLIAQRAHAVLTPRLGHPAVDSRRHTHSGIITFKSATPDTPVTLLQQASTAQVGTVGVSATRAALKRLWLLLFV